MTAFYSLFIGKTLFNYWIYDKMIMLFFLQFYNNIYIHKIYFPVISV